MQNSMDDLTGLVRRAEVLGTNEQIRIQFPLQKIGQDGIRLRDVNLQVILINVCRYCS